MACVARKEATMALTLLNHLYWNIPVRSFFAIRARYYCLPTLHTYEVRVVEFDEEYLVWKLERNKEKREAGAGPPSDLAPLLPSNRMAPEKIVTYIYFVYVYSSGAWTHVSMGYPHTHTSNTEFNLQPVFKRYTRL